MVTCVASLAFLGLEARPIEVQVQLSSGVPAFTIVGLPDKAVSESRERVRSALSAIGLALPPKRITVNLSPADLPKEGSHYDLPIALGLLGAMGVLDNESLSQYLVLGELGLDGRLMASPGALPAAIHASSCHLGLICAQLLGAEAAWSDLDEIIAAPDLLMLIQHLKGKMTLPQPQRSPFNDPISGPDLSAVKGQEQARRALEIAAAGGHNMLMCGPPGAGKSLLAACLPSILPPLDAREALEVSMIASVAGMLDQGRLIQQRPFRAPHHSASMAALVGGGYHIKPGEVSLAHLGVLFLDELPEFKRPALDSLRQPLESGEVSIARANGHVHFPARVQLIAAMNPCRCGHLDDAALACSRAPKCAVEYQNRISGPLLDRIDIHLDMPPVGARELLLPAGENSAAVKQRVIAARALQQARYKSYKNGTIRCNAEADGALIEKLAPMDDAGQKLLIEAVEKMHLSARSYYRLLKIARTIADMAGSENLTRLHIAEALSYRRRLPVA
ncbi:MAG: YifB family Mg chelatase-like AAA ATPase [Zymomonas mobilis subsp. pomaceae]|uniref:Mg chelatase, subunit ChlI n=1 Tax=Zymomonas mobilis subsp. pomaceae (strain ATCC 29192 / DSM 22645 / JCM 10191 / CCUG 17912 / NBRC 13757 / NCIMB 11200 / NRRL B-4491 / Barker I) TaxID=579138 RepID=F8EVP0_ZYMMT|nr:YifB family Mg chelatase-like AAA ATPase [Zymomonas mobilis]AEI38377.1 Mg chelatase, subunit ChlI [Zymomonas mobilis subsp. pomaceae ATCC 29192]MDX5948067.1 YifB family Mg chelatase-like AAA ATPase [Zymomonas mobilis subsp. pomaceae]GEB89396.1 ATPase AAA [Zymomonas mobilis subsp. pomaceae]